jgi:hypothetical protein
MLVIKNKQFFSRNIRISFSQGCRAFLDHSRAGLDRKTVRRFARAATVDELLVKATTRESKLDQFKPYICQRWNEGVTDAAALHAELRERGWAGSAQTVRRYVAPFRQALAAPGPAPRPGSLARRRRSRRPGRPALPGCRHPHRPASSHQWPHPALELRRGRLAGTQNVHVCANHVLIGIEPMPTPIGGSKRRTVVITDHAA